MLLDHRVRCIRRHTQNIIIFRGIHKCWEYPQRNNENKQQTSLHSVSFTFTVESSGSTLISGSSSALAPFNISLSSFGKFSTCFKSSTKLSITHLCWTASQRLPWALWTAESTPEAQQQQQAQASWRQAQAATNGVKQRQQPQARSFSHNVGGRISLPLGSRRGSDGSVDAGVVMVPRLEVKVAGWELRKSERWALRMRTKQVSWQKS